MNKEEREALLDFSRDIPEWIPAGTSFEDWQESASASAIARDAIETWLSEVAPVCEFYVSPMPNPVTVKDFGGPVARVYQIELNFGHRQQAFQAPTKLLALIAAARAVKETQ